MNELTLYGISKEMIAMEELWEMAIDEETGEIKDTALLEELQQGIETTLKEKSADIVKYYKNRDSLIESIDKEIKRLQELKKIGEKKQESFKNYIKMCMEKMGVKKIETSNGNISLRKTPESVDLIDEEIIPKRFKTIVQVEKISKTDIKKALQEGEEVPGATLKRGMLISIK
ncbi:siphovirus Gp157 family protein [Fusobacterium necrogenes]|uniref:siphovirus Gp157 family protein n=1 Tax=Fusobacterium necrogenes TaxID=858 RepID=UPI00255C832D|nr:siphovirus Gp157 family protein [Fusobacterium necrogenes]